MDKTFPLNCTWCPGLLGKEVKSQHVGSSGLLQDLGFICRGRCELLGVLLIEDCFPENLSSV